jgi:N-carbamoyl-L-amino-acid hydrolase
LVVNTVETKCKSTAAKRQVSIQTELLNADAPVDCAPAIIEALSQSCRKHELKFIPMVSRAYHDSLFMARVAPLAMLFIPCRHGYSHRPDEYAAPEDIARGTLVLAETMKALSE